MSAGDAVFTGLVQRGHMLHIYASLADTGVSLCAWYGTVQPWTGVTSARILLELRARSSFAASCELTLAASQTPNPPHLYQIYELNYSIT